MIAYDRWANRKTVDSLRYADRIPERARLWMPHIAGAQHVWLDRLQGTDTGIPIWPRWTIEETAAQLDALNDRWAAYLDAHPKPDLHKPIAYTNTHGKQYADTPADIIQHILLHSNYHRGQIAAEIRAANNTPAVSDFIVALRDPDYPRAAATSPFT